MAKRKEELDVFANVNTNEEMSLDMDAVNEVQASHSQPVVETPVPKQTVRYRTPNDAYKEEELINCLRDEIIEIRFIPQPGTVSDPKHVMFGGMGENSKLVVSVPRLRSGNFVDVLTKSEKAYLEYIMNLEKGALSVYNRHNNFWDNATEGGISKVILQKRDNRLNLSIPEDFIKYKILLAAKDLICPDLQTLRDKRKATYRFVIVSNNEVSTSARDKINTKKRCYMELGKLELNAPKLRTIVEILSHKSVSANTDLTWLQTEAGNLLEADPRLFLATITDELLDNKMLIKLCVEQSFISKRADQYFLRSDGSPLCESGETPTLPVAAKFLASPKRQDLKFSLEAALKQ